MKIIDDNISKVDGYYQISLLWKEEVSGLPFNRAAAEARLQYLKRRFSRDPGLEATYRAVIDDYVIKGYARKLTPEEAAKNSNITWYLPHHPVFNVNKPKNAVWFLTQMPNSTAPPLMISYTKVQTSRIV